MDTKTSASKKWESTVDFLSVSLMSALDDEVISQSDSALAIASDMRLLVNAQLSRRELSLRVEDKGKVMSTSRQVKRRGVGLGKLEMLRRLLLKQPDLAPNLSAAFSAGRLPSQVEVDGVTAELTRLGLLKDNTIANG